MHRQIKIATQGSGEYVDNLNTFESSLILNSTRKDALPRSRQAPLKRRNQTLARAIVRGEPEMPFFNNIYYPYQADSQGAQTSVGIPSLLSSPQSQQSIGSQQHTASAATMSTSVQASASASASVPLPPFRFRSRREAVDWRRISALDVDRVASELDFQSLQEHIAGVTFCSIEAERCQRCQAPMDSGVLKLFRLAQLTVEYLLHSQDYLTLCLQTAEDRVQAEQRQKEQLHVTIQKQADELKALKEELKQRKKIIASQQVMISSGLGGYHKCQHCDKAFMNSSFLHSHMQRRHPDEFDIKLLTDNQKKVHSVRFQEEIERLKEQLSLTRSQLETQQQAYVAKATQEKDFNEKQEELKRDLEKWKEDERRSMNQQIEEIRENCQRDVHLLYQKNTMLEQQLANVQETNRVLVTRIDEDKQGTTQKETKRRVAHPDTLDKGSLSLSEHTKHQQEITSLEQKLQTQEERWSGRLRNIQREHETVKNQLSEDMQRLQKRLTEQTGRQSTVTERVDHQPSTQEQHAQQVKRVSTSPPTIVVKHDTSAPEPKVKPTMPEQAHMLHKLDPIVELSEEEKDSSVSERRSVVHDIQEKVKNFLRNPSAKREMREIVEQTLGDELHSLGIKSETQGLSKAEYNQAMVKIHEKRGEQERESPQWQRRLRVDLSHSLDQRVKDRLAGCSSVSEKYHRTKHNTAGHPKAVSNGVYSKGSQMISSVPAKSFQTPKASSISRTKAQPSTSTPKTYVSSDDESEEGMVPQNTKSSSLRTQPVPVPRTSIPRVVVCKEPVGSAVENDDTWTDGSELEEIDINHLQKSSLVTQSATGKKALGHHVKDLTRSLESQLADQKPPKLAGSVNTINTPNSAGTHSNTKPISKKKDAEEEAKPTVNSSKKVEENDDDYDDWDISSLEDASKPNSTLQGQKTLDSTSTSVWGPSTGHSPKPGLTEAGTGSTLKSSLVSVSSDWSSSEEA